MIVPTGMSARVSPAHAGVEAVDWKAEAEKWSQPRVRGGRGAERVSRAV